MSEQEHPPCACGAFEIERGAIHESGPTDSGFVLPDDPLAERETHTTTLCTRGRRGRVIAAGARPWCPWTSADECATARERSVAGTSAPIPACPVHGGGR